MRVLLAEDTSIPFTNELNIGAGQNNGNTEKLMNRISAGYNNRTPAGKPECSSVCSHSVVLVSVH
jgi:hypothetical protein